MSCAGGTRSHWIRRNSNQLLRPQPSCPVLVPRQAGHDQGCFPPPNEGSPEDTAGRHTSCPCVSSLANSLVVASSGGHVGGTIADCYLLLDTILFSCFTSRIRIFEVGAHIFYMYIYYHVWCVGSFRVGPCGEADRGLVQPYLRLIGVLLYIIYSWSDYSTLGLLPGGIPFLYDWFLLFRTLPYLGDQMKPGIKP